MNSLTSVYASLHRHLVVSCQAPDGDVFSDPESIARFALAAINGGAAGIRANGPEHIRAIRRIVSAPIIGIQKEMQKDGKLLITASFETARQLVDAGADLIALDCTVRGCRYGAIERLKRIRSLLGVPVIADIATLPEALRAARAGADLIATTMRGYTKETAHILAFEPTFITTLVQKLDAPVIAEGRVATPEEARRAIEAGAFAVIVGTAITRPQAVTKSFVQAIEIKPDEPSRFYIGIDLGATNTKYGIVGSDGKLAGSGVVRTPTGGGRDILLSHLQHVTRNCLNLARHSNLTPVAMGIATAGWVNPVIGRVIYATDNLPGWTGTSIAEALHQMVDIPVAVENDANAMAIAEKHFGSARQAGNFVCITLGTGVGGGCYINGRLNRGAHFMANCIGHMPIEKEGAACTCGRKGCLECYANANALLRFGQNAFLSTEDLIKAAETEDINARNAIRIFSEHLAIGITSIIHLLDPELVILSGGLTINNSHLLDDLRKNLAEQVVAWEQRNIAIRFSELGYMAGVFGAAGAALERLQNGAPLSLAAAGSSPHVPVNSNDYEFQRQIAVTADHPLSQPSQC